MPFGDNVKTVKLVGPWDWAGTQKPKTRRVTVPEVEAPWWWSEYLLEEWKRKNGIGCQVDGRTGWQKSDDDWRLRQRGHLLPGSTGMPRHEVWA